MILLSPLDRFGLMAGGRALPAADVLIDTNQDRLDLAAYLIANDHWDGESEATITVTIAPGVNLTSPNGDAFAALFIADSFGSAGVDLTIINMGSIRGSGGNGGGGGTGVTVGPSGGGAGGTAVLAESAVSIDNGSGIIAGGGGGGGGGSGGSIFVGEDEQFVNGGNGGAGAGISGAASGQATDGGNGGNGGALGASGQAGEAMHFPGAPGGAAGNYINGNSNVTWLANGTRLGGAV